MAASFLPAVLSFSEVRNCAWGAVWGYKTFHEIYEFQLRGQASRVPLIQGGLGKAPTISLGNTLRGDIILHKVLKCVTPDKTHGFTNPASTSGVWLFIPGFCLRGTCCMAAMGDTGYGCGFRPSCVFVLCPFASFHRAGFPESLDCGENGL